MVAATTRAHVRVSAALVAATTAQRTWLPAVLPDVQVFASRSQVVRSFDGIEFVKQLVHKLSCIELDKIFKLLKTISSCARCGVVWISDD